MTERMTKFVILKDSQGNYYALPEEGLMQARVPDERRAEIEALINRDSGPLELQMGQLESVVGGADTRGGVSSLGTFETRVPPGSTLQLVDTETGQVIDPG